MKRLARLLLRSAVLLAAIAVLCVASIYLILDTQRGSDWLLKQSLALVSPTASFNTYSGSFAKGVHIEGLKLPIEGLTIELESLHSSWNLWGVLGGRLAIETLHLKELSIHIDQANAAAPDPNTEAAGPWPHLSLPIAINLADLRIDGLHIINADSRQDIERIRLSGNLGLINTTIENFSVDTAKQQLSLEGKIRNRPPYAMNIGIRWAASLDDMPPLSGNAKLKGNLKELRLKHQLIQPSAVDTQLSVKLPFDPEHLEIDAKAISLALSSQWQDVIIPLTSSESGLKQSQSAASNSKPSVNFLSSGTIRLDGSWQDYRLALDTQLSAPTKNPADAQKPQVQSPAQSQTPSAESNDPVEMLSTLLEQPGHLKANISGNQLDLLIKKIALNTGSGALLLAGKVNANSLLASDSQAAPNLGNAPASSTAQAMQWQLTLSTTDLSTIKLLPQWPAKLNSKLSSRGSWQGNNYQASLTIDKLNGEFLGRALNGNGALQVSDHHQEFKNLSLQLGNNQLQLNGRLADTSSLDWMLDAKDLNQLRPDLGGALHSTGSLRGGPLAKLLQAPAAKNPNFPQISAELSASKLRYQGYAVASAELALKLSSDQSLVLNANAAGLSAAPLSNAALSLQANGNIEHHQLALDLKDAESQLSLKLDGGLNRAFKPSKQAAAKPAWQGRIQEFAANHPQLGPWLLGKPAALLAASGAVQLKDFCLTQEQDATPAELCSDLALNDKDIKLKGHIHALSLNRLSASLPPGSSLQGELNSEFNVDGALTGNIADLKGELALSADPILIRYQAGVNEDILEHHASLNAQATLSEQQLRSHLNFNIAEVGSLIASIGTAKPSSTSNINLGPDTKINGEITSQFDNLQWLGGFFPELEKLDGRLNAAMAVAGTLQAPVISGDINLDELNMQLPAVGLALKTGTAQLNLANNGNWQLDAGITSGTGRIKIVGEGSLGQNVQNAPTEQSGPRGNISISGENITAVDLPDASVTISPDINIGIAPELIKIRGSLKIPKGKFVLKSLPEQATSVSADEIIISSNEQASIGAGTPIDTLISITLDDSFEFSGYGFSTRLGGKLRVAQKSQSAVQAFGSLSLYDGIYKAYGQDLSIQRGLLLFQGPVDNPGLNISAVREVKTYTVGINIGGFAQDIRSELFSDPAMPPTDVISMLITGKVPGEMSQSDANQVMNAATALGISQSKGITSTLQNTFGMDVLNLQGGESYEDSSLVVGKYLSPDLFISYVQNLFTPAGSIQLDYTLSKSLGLKAQSGKTQSVDLLYRIEHGKD
ncbi:translocation/assembly module TamB domain-containing protein [Zhongshania guokunii]|uniref:Translocation/assembly module TamB domain-containing protein n=1 Tax=Zhongshania guokunii TaxID=641783 RepID=A0ABV3U8E0_9GAMM